MKYVLSQFPVDDELRGMPMAFLLTSIQQFVAFLTFGIFLLCGHLAGRSYTVKKLKLVQLEIKVVRSCQCLFCLASIVGLSDTAISYQFDKMKWVTRVNRLCQSGVESQPRTTSKEVWTLLCFSLAFAGNIGLNNFSLSLLPMSVNLILRSCLPLATEPWITLLQSRFGRRIATRDSKSFGWVQGRDRRPCVNCEPHPWIPRQWLRLWCRQFPWDTVVILAFRPCSRCDA